MNPNNSRFRHVETSHHWGQVIIMNCKRTHSVDSHTKYKWELPEFKKYEFFPKQHPYCVCVFAINEGKRLQNQLKRMSHLSQCVDIIVADGGSTDNSTDIKLLKSLNVNTLLIKKSVGKLGTQMRMAFGWALKKGYKGVIVIDGNEKDDVKAIPNFISKLKKGYDHIQGSRFISGGYHENTPLLRLFGLKWLHIPIMRLASGFKYTDTTNGFRAYSAHFLKSPEVSVFRSLFTSYELHYYLAARGPRLGFKCSEIPVSRVYPKTGPTPTQISPIKGYAEVVYKLFLILLNRYNP